jgi:hypothetical protein
VAYRFRRLGWQGLQKGTAVAGADAIGANWARRSRRPTTLARFESSSIGVMFEQAKHVAYRRSV